MTEHFATSPFCGRIMNAAHFLSYEELRQKQLKLRDLQNNNQSAAVKIIDRWKLLRALTEAREAYQLSHRTIAVLEALLSFCGDKQLDGQPLIVFPSNYELSMRLRGMSAPTIRRHIACLVTLGFILRRDSPNGKRFARRNSNGEIAIAYGFDLAPLAFKAAEIEKNAQKAQEENRLRQQLRYSITIHLRDIAQMIDAAIKDDKQGEWAHLLKRLQELSGRVQRNGTIEDLSQRNKALCALRENVENLYFSNNSVLKMSASVSQNEHHIQNSELESIIENKEVKEPIKTAQNNKNCFLQSQLDEVLQICPQIIQYARHGIRNWADFIKTANHISNMLGVSASAWQKACDIMGEINAAITIAAILERSDSIRCAGGYLRKLTERANYGQYSVSPVLKTLANTRH